MKKVYFATPVNGRTEPTLAEKKDAALARCVDVRTHLKRLHPDWVICYSFMVCPRDERLTEAEAMGRCITLLMECDMLILDDGWVKSRGCNVECSVANNYDILTVMLKECYEQKKIVKL